MENGLSPIPKHLKQLAINLDHALRLAGNNEANASNIGWSGLGQDVAKIQLILGSWSNVAT
jgi:hypothetical protein